MGRDSAMVHVEEPQMIHVYKCEYCDYISLNELTTAFHETVCEFRPQLRKCPTCKWNKPLDGCVVCTNDSVSPEWFGLLRHGYVEKCNEYGAQNDNK